MRWDLTSCRLVEIWLHLGTVFELSLRTPTSWRWVFHSLVWDDWSVFLWKQFVLLMENGNNIRIERLVFYLGYRLATVQFHPQALKSQQNVLETCSHNILRNWMSVAWILEYDSFRMCMVHTSFNTSFTATWPRIGSVSLWTVWAVLRSWPKHALCLPWILFCISFSPYTCSVD
jgi:hypothetical protein